jgi:hypothetical protein
MSFPFDPLDAPPPPPRKVRFAPFTQVFWDIPWECARPDPLFVKQDALIQSDLQDSADNLRTNLKSEDAATLAGVFLLVICLLVLFLMVWFVAGKILMLEADSEIERQARRRVLRFG